MALKNNVSKGRAATASYGSAALLTTVPTTAKNPAQFTGRSEATIGYWILTFKRASGPTTTDYSIKLAPGEPFSEEMPPTGEVWALTDGGTNGVLSWYLSYKT